MSAEARLLNHLARVLHPGDAPPQGPAWNHDDLIDLLPPGAQTHSAAVLVPLLRRPQGMQVLLTRRTEGLRHHGGQISFPGGRIEALDAGPLAAALRETHEEIGLCPDAITPLGFLDPFFTISAFHVFPLVASVDPDAPLRVDPREVAEVFEVPLAFVLDPANLSHGQTEVGGRMRAWVEFRYGSHRIWGATAAMLVNLRQRLEAA